VEYIEKHTASLTKNQWQTYYQVGVRKMRRAYSEINNTSLLGLKENLLIRFVCDTYGIEPPPNKKLKKKWFASIYLDQSFDLIKKDERLRNYTSSEWNKAKRFIFSKYGEICLRCGSKENIHLDHIKPYSLFPELSLDLDNLQPLCQSCNSSKGNRRTVDYRNSKFSILQT
jgi:5-methylcytosine-specific restriction endonuclease McrA